MDNLRDLFLLLSSSIEFQSYKVLIKNLYSSFDNLLELFTNNFKNLDSKLKKEEIKKLQDLNAQINKLKINTIKKILEEKDIKYLAYCEENYPKKLKAIDDPPVGLFYKGNIDVLSKTKSVAIVGTRSATNYGMNISSKIASLLAEQNIIVISGLASGIDASAHIGSLKTGKTIAVLGTGVDIVFPISNEKLFKEVIDKDSLIISEYPPGTDGLPWNFPQRNRIISALSDAVVIIEGDLQSGAMITARFAIKQGKPLFALPGSIDSPMSNGPNILIKSGVAELLTSVNDILEKIGESKQIEIKFDDGKSNLDKLTERQKNIYNSLSSHAKGFDSLIQETNLASQELIRELSMLELKGIIEKTIDGGYVRL